MTKRSSVESTIVEPADWLLLAVSLMAFAAVVLVTAVATHGALNDDTYITLRYAKNLASAHQFTYNVGYPTYSLTCPLWGLVLGVVVGPFTHSLPVLAQVLSLACAALAAVLLWSVGKSLGCRLPAGVALLFLADPYVAGAVSNGTEMGLFCLLAALILRLMLVRRQSLSVSLALGCLLGLLVLARPEGLVYGCGVIAYLLWNSGLRAGLRQSAVALVGAALCLAPWLWFAQSFYGTMVPTSILLKSVDSADRVPFSSTATMRALSLLILKGWVAYALVVAVATVANVRLWSGEKSWRVSSARTRYMITLTGMVAAILLGYFGFLKEVSISSRYLVVVSPLLAVIAWVLIDKAWAAFGGRVTAIASAVAAIGLVVMLGIGVGAIASRAQRAQVQDLPRVYTGKWLAAHVPRGEAVLNFGGAGAIAFFYDGPVWDYDLVSRVGPDLELAMRRRRGEELPAAAYLSRHPAFVVVDVARKAFFDYDVTVYTNDVFRVLKRTGRNRASELGLD